MVATAFAQPHRFTVHDYHRMVDAGILSEDSRVELIEGEVVEMVPIGSRQVAVVNQLNAYFAACAGPSSVSVIPRSP
ncbi:hypothetical protein [Endothiovibrio diazotrophicus]